MSFLDSIAAPTPTPGGGSVAALSCACAAALGEMVCGITLRKAPAKDVEQLAAKFKTLRTELTQAFHADASAFDGVMAAFALPKGMDDEKAKRRMAIEEATKTAARVPLSVARAGVETLRLLREVSGLAGANVASDLTVATQMAAAGIRGATANVRINLESLKDVDFVAATRRDLEVIERELC